LSVWLANLRVAPIQVCSLGHSVSTFGSEIDYALSGADVEAPDDPGRNYSERLVLLPGWGAVHSRPAYTPAGSGHRAQGDVFLLNGPWNAPKVNHRFALTLQELFRRSRRPVRLRLFVSASLNRQNDYLPFVRDLHALLGPDAVEVRLGLPYAEYMAQMEQGDACLDSYHFGGCNTVADALHLRKLIVCREGDRWYNRIGPAMLRSAGLPELATTTEEQFLDVTLRLIHDDAFRADLQDRLDRADLATTVFGTADAAYFGKALDTLITNHDRFRQEGSRSPIRIERDGRPE
jgi:predicted O-linked N-acetylglucosamine transferase (SPINDLY family)